MVSWFAAKSVVTVSGVVTAVGVKRVCSAPEPQVVMASSVPGKGAPGSRGSVLAPVRTLASVSKAMVTIELSISRSVFRVMRYATESVATATRNSTMSAALLP